MIEGKCGDKGLSTKYLFTYIDLITVKSCSSIDIYISTITFIYNTITFICTIIFDTHLNKQIQT